MRSRAVADSLAQSHLSVSVPFGLESHFGPVGYEWLYLQNLKDNDNVGTQMAGVWSPLEMQDPAMKT